MYKPLIKSTHETENYPSQYLSLNDALSGFNANLDLHYRIANKFEADGFIVGSSTIISANDIIPTEEENDYLKKTEIESDTRPYWVIVDSKGRLKDKLHYYRRMEYIKDIIVLITHLTPPKYVEYLTLRNYDFIQTKGEYVDFKKAFILLRSKYDIKVMLSDSGATLNNILLNRNLVDELSIIISPILIPDSGNRLFNKLELAEDLKLELIEFKELEMNHLWIRYKINNK